jgi:hypothetical protein
MTIKRLLPVVIAIACTALPRIAAAAEFKVIANPSVKSSDISTDDLKNVFLSTKTALADGSQVEPVLAKAGPAHEAFLKDLGKTDAALSTYYRSLVFTGKGSMPKICGSDAEVVDYVAKTKGAIGYVSDAASVAGVKTLAVK